MSMLFIVTDPPYRNQHFIESLETALVAAVFDQQVSLLLKDDAVWGLLPGQDGGTLGRRTVSKVLAALPEYDVHQLYVCGESLAHRGLADTSLPSGPNN